MNIYTKQPLSIDDQIARLKAQGLVINDEELAAKTLGEISYFRFAAYLRPMEADKQTHQFKPGSTFENAVALYEFDNALRQLLFTAIQRIEVALRSKIIQHFSMRHGAFWFMQMPLHNSEHRFLENLGSLDREVTRSKEDFIKEHFRNYDKPEFPPAWKTLELTSFGTLSKLYYNFADKKVKKLVAREFNLPQHEVLESWMRSLAALRNHCAHHARLWNRYFNATPQMNAHMRGNWIANRQIDPNKLYAVLCCIVYWLDAMNRGDEFRKHFIKLLSDYPSVDTAAMGFPQGWQQELLWQTNVEQKSVFIVDTLYERYEDFHTWNEVAFVKRQDAEAYLAQIDGDRPQTPVIDSDLWWEAEKAWLDQNDNTLGKNWDANPYKRSEHPMEYEQWERDFFEREVRFYFDYINARSSKQYTMEEIRQQAQYANHQMNEWLRSQIKEIPLMDTILKRR